MDFCVLNIGGCLVPTLPEGSKLFREILGENYLNLKICSINISEDFEKSLCLVDIGFQGFTNKIKGCGYGIIDALFKGLFETFSEEYQSLKSIELTRFIVKTDHHSKNDPLGSTAACSVLLEIRNSEGNRFEFRTYSRSLTRAAAGAVSSVAEYFINSERAYVVLWKSLEDAKKRNRQDLVEKYTVDLATITDNTSYTELIEDLKKKLK